MTNDKHFKPGEICEVSGLYEIVDVDGKKTGKERAISTGEHFPPTPTAGQSFVLVDAARTGEGRDGEEGLRMRIRRLFQRREGRPAEQKHGIRVFVLTLAILLILITAYAVAHAVTSTRHEHLHSEASTVTGDRFELLVLTTELEGDLGAPASFAAPAVKAIRTNLEQSVLRAEDSNQVLELFDQAIAGLVELGLGADGETDIRRSATTKIGEILKEARTQANNHLVAVEAEKGAEETEEPPGVSGDTPVGDAAPPEEGAESSAETAEAGEVPSPQVAARLLQIELDRAEELLLDYIVTFALKSRLEEVGIAAEGLGYDEDTDVGKAIAEIETELNKDQPNRRLAAELVQQVSKEVSGLRQSLFWSDEALRWLEVIAWSLAGMLCVRLLSVGRFLGRQKYEPKWDWWWWAKIVQAPIMAVVVVMAFTYLELGVASGETLGLKLSLRNQPVEVIIAVSFIVGMFSDKAYQFLENLAEQLMPDSEQKVRVPSFLGMIWEDAKKLAEEKDLKPVKKEIEKEGVESSRVFGQSAQEGVRLMPGSRIELSVAKAPTAQVDVPGDLKGKSLDEAKAKLQASFTVKSEERIVTDQAEVGKVVDWDPKGKAAKGSTVTLFVGKLAPAP